MTTTATETGTGILDVMDVHGVPLRFAWNGNPDDRAEARRAFEAAVATGSLASVWTGPRESVQVHSFEQVEEMERDLGTVEVTVRPRVVGG